MKNERGTIKLINLILIFMLTFISTIVVFVLLRLNNVDTILDKDTGNIISNPTDYDVIEDIDQDISKIEDIDHDLTPIKIGGELYNVKILENGEIMVPHNLMEKILSCGNIHYDKNSNILKFGIWDNDVSDIIRLTATIDINTGVLSGRNIHGFLLKDTVLPVLPEVRKNKVYLPFFYLYGVMQTNYDAIFYPEYNELQYKLERYEAEFKKDFPFYTKKELYENRIDDENFIKTLVFISSDNKYGIVNYEVKEELIRNENYDSFTRKQHYVGYKIVFDAVYDDYGYINDGEINLIALKNGNGGVIYNSKTNEISEEFEEISYFYSNFKVMKNGKYGLYGLTKIEYDDIWYEQGETSGSKYMKTTPRYIFGFKNGKKILIKELAPAILCIDY